MTETVRRIKPNIAKTVEMLNNQDSQYLIIVEADGEVTTCNKIKNPTKLLELHAKILDKSPSTARLKSVEKTLKSIRSNNKSSYLGSPTLNEEELQEIEDIADQIEDIILRAANRWQLEKPQSQFEIDNLKLYEDMRKSGVLKSPKAKPYMKVLEKGKESNELKI